MLKDKLRHIKNFEFIWAKIDLIQTASNLADRKKLQGAVQNERFLYPEGSRNKEIILDQKVCWLLQGSFHLGDGRGSNQMDYLVSASQAIPDWLV